MSAQYRTPQQVPGKPPGSCWQSTPLLASLLSSPSQSGTMTGNSVAPGYPTPGSYQNSTSGIYGYSGRAGYPPPSIYRAYPPYGMNLPYGYSGYPANSPPGIHPKDLFPGMMPPTNSNQASGPNVQSQAPQGTRSAVQPFPPKATNGLPAKSVSAPTVQSLGSFDSLQRHAFFGSGPNVQSQAPNVMRPVPQYPQFMGPQMCMGPGFVELHGLPRGHQMAPYPWNPFATTVASAQTGTSSNTCPNKFVTVFGPKNTYLKFHYNSKTGKIVQHKCVQCMGKVSEKNLFQLYSKWHEPISNYVLFASNNLTNMNEQYIFSPKTGGLEQVNYPELKYNSSEINECSEGEIIIYKNGDEQVFVRHADDSSYLRKEHFKYGQSRVIPEVPVKTLLMKELEEKKSDEEEEESEKEKDVERNVEDENEYSEYLRTLPPFKIRYCISIQNDIVYILSPNNGSYLKFVFNKTKQEYESHNCKECKDFITEYHLIPKYSVYSNTVKTYVFHCKNTETSRMEQYIYDEKTQGFEQVYLPELKYSSSMDTTSNTLLVLTGNNCGATSIMRDLNTGKFIKEKYCLKTNQFVHLPKVPVRTFSVKIMESENQKKTIQKTEEPKIQEKKTSEKNLEEPEIQNKKDSDEPKIQEASVKDSEEPQLKNKEDSEESPEDVDNLIREMNECMKQFSLLNDKMTAAMKKEEQMKQLTVTIDENQDPLLNSQKQHQALQIPE